MSDHRVERLGALKAEAVETLRLPIDGDKVTLLAALRLAHEVQLERLVAGGAVDPATLLNLTETIDKLTLGLPPPPMTRERYLEMKQRETAS